MINESAEDYSFPNNTKKTASYYKNAVNLKVVLSTRSVNDILFVLQNIEVNTCIESG